MMVVAIGGGRGGGEDDIGVSTNGEDSRITFISTSSHGIFSPKRENTGLPDCRFIQVYFDIKPVVSEAAGTEAVLAVFGRFSSSDLTTIVLSQSAGLAIGPV